MAGIFVMLSALACSDSTAPDSRVPRLGRYRFVAPLDSGTLTITSASAAQVAGRWDVPRYQPQVVGGTWIDSEGIEGYSITAQYRDVPGSSTPLPASFRIRRDGDGMRCSLASQVAGGCTLSYLGP